MSGGQHFVPTRSYQLAQPYLGELVTVHVDRPLGSRHPRYREMIYSLNYGHVPGVIAPDGGALDAYILGVFVPLGQFTGRCIAIVHRHDDDDDKLIIVPDGRTFTDDQILALTEFVEKGFDSVVMRK